jgi:hypothetical protein
MCSALLSDHARDGLVHLGAADKRTGSALVEQSFQRCPLQIVVLHALPQQVDPLLQHPDDTRIAPGFEQFLGETVLFVGQRDRGFRRYKGTPLNKVIPSSTRVNCPDWWVGDRLPARIGALVSQ